MLSKLWEAAYSQYSQLLFNKKQKSPLNHTLLLQQSVKDANERVLEVLVYILSLWTVRANCLGDLSFYAFFNIVFSVFH